MNAIFNEKRTIRSQLMVSFNLAVVIAVGISLAICLGFLDVLGKVTYSLAENSVQSQTKNNAKIDAEEISATIVKKLDVVASSGSIVTAEYASILLQDVFKYNSLNSLRLTHELSFKEYSFVDGCSYPDCPADYGDLEGRSRLSNLSGSMDSSSVYLYSTTSMGARNDAAWDSLVSSNSDIEKIIDSLAFLDTSWKTLYTDGPDASLFYYLSVKTPASSYSSNYNCVHRVYPGNARNDSSYNPPQRGWFRNAPTEGYYLEGPYKETFTGEHVVTLSTRRVVQSSTLSSSPVTVVGATVMLLSSLADLIRDLDYPNSGFGALVKYDTLEIIVWGTSERSVYDDINNKFFTLDQWDPELATHNIQRESTIKYTDASGQTWLVNSLPCLQLEYGPNDYALIALVFSNWDEATQTLPRLQDDINSTEGGVTLFICLLCAALCVGMLIATIALVTWLTAPLEKIGSICTEIIRITAEDAAKRDYSQVVHDSHDLTSRRTDEIGVLASSFGHMVMHLHNAMESKRQLSKYSPNPLHRDHTQSATAAHELLTINNMFDSLFSVSNSVDTVVVEEIASAPALPTDALSTLMFSAVPLGDPDDLEAGHNDTPNKMKSMEIDVSNSKYKGKGNISSSKVAVSEDPVGYAGLPVANAVLPVVPEPLVTVTVYLSALGALLLAGLLAVMIITVVTLKAEGFDWMSGTTSSITTQEMTNLKTITSAKAEYMKVSLYPPLSCICSIYQCIVIMLLIW